MVLIEVRARWAPWHACIGGDGGEACGSLSLRLMDLNADLHGVEAIHMGGTGGMEAGEVN